MQTQIIMNLIFTLRSLPELKRLDARRRHSALVEWQIELWRSWSFYLCEISIWLGSFIFFDGLWHLAGQNWKLVSFPTIIAFLVALLLRNHLLYLRKRGVLEKILEAPAYVA